MAEEIIKKSKMACVYFPIPFSPQRRQIVYDKPNGNESILTYLSRVDIPIPKGDYFTLRINGTLIPRNWWGRVYPKPHCFITITATTRGGGGGLFGAIAAITISAIAPVLAPALLGSLGITATTFTLGLAAGIMSFAGSYVISALFAPQIPGNSLSSRSGTDQAVSPTYSISGGNNASRRYQPLPVVLGSHLIFPDIGSIPYTQFEGDNQYLYQIYEFGVADTNITDVKIGTTPLTSFEEVETETAPFSTGAITLFPANTQPTAGPTLEASESTFVTRTSASDAVALRVEFEGDIITLNKQTGDVIADSMTLVVEYRLSSGGGWSPLIDSSNVPQGITLDENGYVVLSSESRKKVRASLYRTVAENEYEVRVRRVPSENDGISTSTRNMSWTQLLSHQKDPGNYENRKRYAIRVRASGQISGVLDRVSAVASTPIPVWNGASEVIQESSNPGHLFIFFARGAANTDGRRRFGGLLADSRIDLAGLRVWADWCDVNDLRCDMIVDTALSTYEVLSNIARCGRATVSWNSGKLGVVFDEEDRPPTQIFGLFNIKADTFYVGYFTENLANEIVVGYIDRDREYQRHQVRVAVPGEASNDKPADIELTGVTRLSQAAEEANLIAASQFYRRKKVVFEADLENLVAVRGDVITIAHDLTAWALSGRLVAGTTTVLQLDREVDVTADSYITIRKPDLTLTTHEITTSPSTTDTVTITPALALAPDSDPDNKVKDYVWQFEDSTSPGKNFKIIDIKTNSDFSAAITAVEEVPAYYTAKSGTFEFIDNDLYNGATASVSDISFAETVLDNSGATSVTISWKAAQTSSVDLDVSINGGSFETYPGLQSSSFSVVAKGGDTIDVKLRANAIVRLRDTETIQSARHTVVGLTALPEDVTSFTVSRNGDDAVFRWSPVSDKDLDFYEIRKGSTWNTSILIEKTKSLSYRTLDVTTGTYLIKATDLGGRQSENATAVIINSTAAVNVVFQDNEQDSNWPGTFSNTEINTSNQLTLSATTTWSDWTDPWTSYSGSWQSHTVLNESGTYVTQVYDLGASFDESTRVDISVGASSQTSGYTWASLSLPWVNYHTGWTWAGPEGRITVKVEVQTSDDDITYTNFSDFVPGAFNARYFKFRITLTTLDANVIPLITAFNATFDVPDRVEKVEDQTISVAGTTINFSRAFTVTPNVQVTLQSASEGDTYLITSKSASSVTIKVFDDSGTDIGGNVDVHARGY